MTPRNCVIIHGCPATQSDTAFDKHWIPWVKKELNARGIPTIAPHMSEPWNPNYEAYKKEFQKEDINEQTTLIGHSCGASFLVRWLGESKRKIDTLILVAPWKIAGENDMEKAFYEYPIDGTIPSRVGRIVFFTADNEEREGKESLEIFHSALGGIIVNLSGRGHYVMDDMGTEKFPELIDEVIN